jgi:hypothetical protein
VIDRLLCSNPANSEDSLFEKIFFYLCGNVSGLLAEGLGSGLQNRVRRFKSARDLNKILARLAGRDFLFAAGVNLFAKAGKLKITRPEAQGFC